MTCEPALCACGACTTVCDSTGSARLDRKQQTKKQVLVLVRDIVAVLAGWE